MDRVDRIQRSIAWLLPKGVVKWCFYRMTAYATQGRWGNESPLGMPWEIITQRWDSDKPCCYHPDEDTCKDSCFPCERWCCPDITRASTKGMPAYE